MIHLHIKDWGSLNQMLNFTSTFKIYMIVNSGIIGEVGNIREVLIRNMKFHMDLKGGGQKRKKRYSTRYNHVRYLAVVIWDLWLPYLIY